MSAEDCIEEIKAAAGRPLSDEDVLRILEAIEARRKAKAAERSMLSAEDQLRMAGAEIADETKAAALIEKRNAAKNYLARTNRRSYYDDIDQGLESLTGKRARGSDKAWMAMDAKLAGINTPVFGGKASVHAEQRGLESQYVSGLFHDLDNAGLFDAARRGDMDRDVARELAELNRTEGGKPGITKSKLAKSLAGVFHKYQRLAVDNLNRAGAWIGDYDGYVMRTSHNPNRMLKVGMDGWLAKTMPRLDSAKTFEGVDDPQAFMRGVYNALVTGVHMTAEPGLKAEAFVGPGNLAKRLSQGRVLHFKDADAWHGHIQEFGHPGSLFEQLVRSLEFAARDTVLMRTFGTNPRSAFDGDVRWLQEKYRNSDPEAVRRLNAKSEYLSNVFDQLDGSAHMVKNRLWANIGAGWRAWESVSKLGNILLSSLGGDLATKAGALKSLGGVNLLEAYTDGVASYFRGRGNTPETRALAEDLAVGVDQMIRARSRFDPTDNIPGRISSLQNLFFRWSGNNYHTDAQRFGAAAMAGRSLARQKGRAWDAIAPDTRRTLGQYGITPAEWDAVRTANLRNADGLEYVTPSAAGDNAALATKLQSFFVDFAETAVLQPGARERAILIQGTRPGSGLGELLRLFTQFKAYPVTFVTRTIGREMYGGEGGGARVGGVVHMVASSMALGYLSMTLKDLAKGREPRDPTSPKTWTAAMLQGGGLGIYGDFLFGEYNRFGQGALETLGGPSAGMLSDVLRLWQGAREGDPKADQAFRLFVQNVPFANLFYVKPALDYLVLYQIQEALNPGFLRRMESRVEKQNNAAFFLKPSEAIPYGGGDRLFEGVR